MFHMPTSSPMIKTMLGFVSAACAAVTTNATHRATAHCFSIFGFGFIVFVYRIEWIALALVSLHRVYWTEPVEFLDFNVPGSRGLSYPNGASLQHLLLLLSLLRRRLHRQRLLICVELGLFPDVDFVLRRSGKHVVQFPLIRHG